MKRAQLAGGLVGAVGEMRGHVRRVEDAVDVLVLGDRVGGDTTVGGAREHHRQLAVEVQPLLQHARHVAELLPTYDGEVGLVSSTPVWPLPS